MFTFKANKKTSCITFSIILISTVILLGSFYRYVRIFPDYSKINYIPYILQIIIIIFIFFRFTLIRNKYNVLDVLFSLLFLSVIVTFLKLSIDIGYWQQIGFATKYILPIPIYFFVRFHNGISYSIIDALLRVFVVLAFIFISIEFITINYMGISIFRFGDYWDKVGNYSYHGSAVTYAFIGHTERPWGPMALPQSSGTMFAAFFSYFMGKRVLMHRDLIKKTNLLYIIISLLGVYISGSKTASIVVAIIFIMLYRKNIKLVFSIIISFIIFNVFIHFEDPQLQAKSFMNAFPNAIEGISVYSLDRFFDVIFGQGVLTDLNQVIGIGEIHILNQLFYLGSISFILIVLISLKLWFYSIKRIYYSSRSNNSFKYTKLFLLYIFALIIGSLHYDTLFRYPCDVIVLTMIGYISRVNTKNYIMKGLNINYVRS